MSTDVDVFGDPRNPELDAEVEEGYLVHLEHFLGDALGQERGTEIVNRLRAGDKGLDSFFLSFPLGECPPSTKLDWKQPRLTVHTKRALFSAALDAREAGTDIPLDLVRFWIGGDDPDVGNEAASWMVSCLSPSPAYQRMVREILLEEMAEACGYFESARAAEEVLAVLNEERRRIRRRFGLGA
jgi:hypothetical protein